MLTYAIGDIHGRYDLFVEMLEAIKAHATASKIGEFIAYRIVTLGDYIDRGPQSREVLDVLTRRPDIVKLRGNHEDMLLQARAGDQNAVYHFLQNGGDATCQSFGVELPQDIPEVYFAFIRNHTRMYYEDPLRIFVHAGVSHARDTAATQPEQVLLWIRNGFLEYNEPFFKHVVHGHTPQHKFKPVIEAPELLFNRTNLDTGAVYTGVLPVVSSTKTRPGHLM